MNLSFPLAGVGMLVTRPQGQARRFMARIRELGGETWWLPGLEIEPPAEMTGFLKVVNDLERFDWVVFVSPTAVERAWPAIAERGGLPARVRVAAVGRGSARELAKRGVHDVLTPEAKADSESLLALPELKAMAGQRVALFRGEGGRTLLAETLGARGAEVFHAVCYRRVLPKVDVAPVLHAWRAGRIQAVTAFSRDSLDGLVALLTPEGRELLCQTPLFVPHPRIAGHARTLGMTQIIVTPAGEDGVLQALTEHFAHVRT
ncbi:MAG: uroporphyrinogen-III synthase [Thiobacillaceae bacterium]